MKDARPEGSVFSCRCTCIAPKFSDVAKEGPSQVHRSRQSWVEGARGFAAPCTPPPGLRV